MAVIEIDPCNIKKFTKKRILLFAGWFLETLYQRYARHFNKTLKTK